MLQQKPASLAAMIILLSVCCKPIYGQTQDGASPAASVGDAAPTSQPGGKTLQGYAEQSADQTRIQRPLNSTPAPLIQGNVGQDAASLRASVLNSQDFASPPAFSGSERLFIPQAIPNSSPLSGATSAGQDDYWVNWDAWRHRMADAVWGPIKAQRMIMWGCTRVEYDVTRDHRIRITSVRTPDPTGHAGRTLAESIMSLDGNPILEFPAGSRQVVHHNVNSSFGLPVPSRMSKMIYFRGGTEHVTEQW